MFNKTHGLILLTLLLLLLSVSSVCAADNVSAVNVSDNVSENISETNVSESNAFTVSHIPVWTEPCDTQIEVNPSNLSGSDGDFINFTARVYYSVLIGFKAIGPTHDSGQPIYDSGQCFGGNVSLHEDGKLIDSVILSEDNDGAASFSFKFKAGHRYHLEYHGYRSLQSDEWLTHFYEDSSKDLNITIV